MGRIYCQDSGGDSLNITWMDEVPDRYVWDMAFHQRLYVSCFTFDCENPVIYVVQQPVIDMWRYYCEDCWVKA